MVLNDMFDIGVHHSIIIDFDITSTLVITAYWTCNKGTFINCDGRSNYKTMFVHQTALKFLFYSFSLYWYWMICLRLKSYNHWFWHKISSKLLWCAEGATYIRDTFMNCDGRSNYKTIFVHQIALKFLLFVYFKWYWIICLRLESYNHWFDINNIELLHFYQMRRLKSLH